MICKANAPAAARHARWAHIYDPSNIDILPSSQRIPSVGTCGISLRQSAPTDAAHRCPLPGLYAFGDPTPMRRNFLARVEMHLEPQQTEFSADPCSKARRKRDFRENLLDPVRPTVALDFPL